MLRTILIMQLITYVSVGVLFVSQGNLRLGAAQFLLTGVQTLLFWEGLFGG